MSEASATETKKGDLPENCIMKQLRLNRIVSTLKPAGLATALFLGVLSACATDNRAPDLSDPTLANLIPPGGTNKVHFHAYAVGFQIYHWNAAANSWGTSTPSAVLYDSDDNVVATHYAGPTWESNSGSTVTAVRVSGSTPDSSAIPWLLLKATPQTDNGIFARTTYIQRVNTVGGKAPARSGAFDGEEYDSAYTAEYFFYRDQ